MKGGYFPQATPPAGPFFYIPQFWLPRIQNYELSAPNYDLVEGFPNFSF